MTQQKRKIKFLSPLVFIVATLTLLVGIVVFAFRYYPILTLVAIILSALFARFFVKREHLTFFQDEYDADVFPKTLEVSERESEA